MQRHHHETFNLYYLFCTILCISAILFGVIAAPLRRNSDGVYLTRDSKERDDTGSRCNLLAKREPENVVHHPAIDDSAEAVDSYLFNSNDLPFYSTISGPKAVKSIETDKGKRSYDAILDKEKVTGKFVKNTRDVSYYPNTDPDPIGNYLMSLHSNSAIGDSKGGESFRSDTKHQTCHPKIKVPGSLAEDTNLALYHQTTEDKEAPGGLAEDTDLVLYHPTTEDNDWPGRHSVDGEEMLDSNDRVPIEDGMQDTAGCKIDSDTHLNMLLNKTWYPFFMWPQKDEGDILSGKPFLVGQRSWLVVAVCPSDIPVLDNNGKVREGANYLIDKSGNWLRYQEVACKKGGSYFSLDNLTCAKSPKFAWQKLGQCGSKLGCNIHRLGYYIPDAWREYFVACICDINKEVFMKYFKYIINGSNQRATPSHLETKLYNVEEKYYPDIPKIVKGLNYDYLAITGAAIHIELNKLFNNKANKQESSISKGHYFPRYIIGTSYEYKLTDTSGLTYGTQLKNSNRNWAYVERFIRCLSIHMKADITAITILADKFKFENRYGRVYYPYVNFKEDKGSKTIQTFFAGQWSVLVKTVGTGFLIGASQNLREASKGHLCEDNYKNIKHVNTIYENMGLRHFVNYKSCFDHLEQMPEEHKCSVYFCNYNKELIEKLKFQKDPDLNVPLDNLLKPPPRFQIQKNLFYSLKDHDVFPYREVSETENQYELRMKMFQTMTKTANESSWETISARIEELKEIPGLTNKSITILRSKLLVNITVSTTSLPTNVKFSNAEGNEKIKEDNASQSSNQAKTKKKSCKNKKKKVNANASQSSNQTKTKRKSRENKKKKVNANASQSSNQTKTKRKRRKNKKKKVNATTPPTTQQPVNNNTWWERLYQLCTIL